MKAVGLGVLGLGANRAADALDFKGKVDRILGVSQKDQNRGSFTTGQLLADSQPARVDSEPNIQKENLYSAKLEQAKKEMRDLITPEVVARIRLYEPLIRQVAQKAKIPPDLFLGQAIAESLCDPDAVSEAGAAGLFQIMPYLYEKYEIDPFDPQQNTQLAAQLLKEEYEKFGEWSLAIWPWHIGDPEVYNAVQTFAHLEYVIQLPDEKVEIIDDSEEAKNTATEKASEIITMYKNFITVQKINVQKLYENLTVRSMYEGKGYDRTWDYLPRIEASVPIYNSQNLTQAAQQQ